MINKTWDEMLLCLEGSERNQMFNKMKAVKECLKNLKDYEVKNFVDTGDLRKIGNPELDLAIAELESLINGYAENNLFYDC